MTALTVVNRQRARAIDVRSLRRIVRALIEEQLEREDYDLSVCLLGEEAMTRLNEEYLHHQGCTDVITFDYSDPQNPNRLAGEIFVCVYEAVRQAARFRVAWDLELVRYMVHGVLHLSGHDDTTPKARQVMKKQENRLLRRLAATFQLGREDSEKNREDPL